MRRSTIVVALLLLMPAGCHPGGKEESSVPGRAGRPSVLAPRPVQLIAPEVRSENPTLDLVGELRADEMVQVPAEVSGRVDKVLAEVGDRLAKGKPLAWIDRAMYRLRLDQAEANVKAAEANLVLADKELARKKDLLSDRTISQAVFDRAQAGHDLAAAELEASRATRDLARKNFSRSVARVPGDGVVAKRFVTVGQWVETGDPVMEVALGHRIKVAAKVPEAWMNRLVGLKSFRFGTSAADQPYTARVYSIQPVAEGSSRAFEIVGLAEVHTGRLRPGMFVHVKLTSPVTVESLWLPAEAVAISDLPEVMLVRDGRIEVRKVRTGRREDDSIEILRGIGPKERVIAHVGGLSRGLSVVVEDAG